MRMEEGKFYPLIQAKRSNGCIGVKACEIIVSQSQYETRKRISFSESTPH